ncbi:hypothetical protein F5B22DRAFT_652729 [Xylaria bambusicola]|uniref:uncharacterized protein n=1 Tax=Xylaria bambusicola TaxID=326684 RepID=UPI00200886BF|nr:uncharacterized protein F5B22DRAFT_652729 [Xylaria bambusicola]KAI0502802.1 hypothetical protein F5B22DRAFT_652729 [Xylaria bambusicola]
MIEVVNFYFEWPAEFFDPGLLVQLETIPIDLNLRVASYCAPGYGIPLKDSQTWVTYFVRIIDTLVNRNDVDDWEWLKTWLRRTIISLPGNWIQDRIWKHELADQLEQLIIPNLQGANRIQGVAGYKDGACPEVQSLVCSIKTFREVDLLEYSLV